MGNISMESIVSVEDREMGDLSTLTKSIEQLGLLQPIILSPLPDGRYMVVDGRRRLAALRALGYKVLPERAYTFAPQSGDTALMSHAANVERKALLPSEELAQLAALAQDHTTEELATRLGRSPGWIARRLKIRDLNEEWRKVLDDPELARAWTLDKLALIARQPEHIQESLEWMIDEEALQSAEELRRRIELELLSLSTAIFDTAGCANCVNNSSCQQLLFDDLNEGHCLDEECFRRKTVENLKTKLKARPELIPVRNYGGGLISTDEDFPKALTYRDWKELRDPKPGETPNALIVAGDFTGKEMVVVELKAAARGKKTAAQAAAEAETQAKKEPTLEEREAVLAQKRNRRALELLADYLQKQYKGKAWAEAVPECQKLDHFLNTVRLYGFTGDLTYDSRCQLTRKQVIPATDRLFEAVYDQARSRLAQNLLSEARDTLADISREAGDAVAELCCIIPKWLEIKQQAALEVPEPKALIEQRMKEKGGKR